MSRELTQVLALGSYLSFTGQVTRLTGLPLATTHCFHLSVEVLAFVVCCGFLSYRVASTGHHCWIWALKDVWQFLGLYLLMS